MVSETKAPRLKSQFRPFVNELSPVEGCSPRLFGTNGPRTASRDFSPGIERQRKPRKKTVKRDHAPPWLRDYDPLMRSVIYPSTTKSGGRHGSCRRDPDGSDRHDQHRRGFDLCARPRGTG